MFWTIDPDPFSVLCSFLIVARSLLSEGAHLHIYDPKVLEEDIVREFPKGSAINVFKDPYLASAKTHALVICTEWEEFKEYDYAKIFSEMMKPAFIFDGRKLLNHAALAKIGFHVETIGKKFEFGLVNGHA